MAEPSAEYEFAFQEGVRAIEGQNEALRDLRDRAGTLAGVVGVIAGLGLTVFAQDERLSEFTYMATLGAFAAVVAVVVVVVMTVAIWAPVPGRFVNDPQLLIRDYIETDPPATLAEMHRDVALHLGRNATAVADIVSERMRYFTIALLAMMGLIVGTVLIALDLGT